MASARMAEELPGHEYGIYGRLLTALERMLRTELPFRARHLDGIVLERFGPAKHHEEKIEPAIGRSLGDG